MHRFNLPLEFIASVKIILCGTGVCCFMIPDTVLGGPNLIQDSTLLFSAGSSEGSAGQNSSGGGQNGCWYIRPGSDSAITFYQRLNTTNDCSSIGGSGAPHYEIAGLNSINKGIAQDVTESLSFFNALKKSTVFSYSVKVKNLGSATNAFSIQFRARFNGSDQGAGNQISVAGGNHPIAADGAWHTLTGTFTVNWDADPDYVTGLRWARVHLGQSLTANNTFQFDDFTLAEDSHVSTNFPPTAEAVVLPGSGGNNIQLNAGRSRDPEGAIGTYEWDFGEGSGWQTGTRNQAHTYAANGSYTARLRVTDTQGNSTITSTIVVVPFLPRPTAYDGYAATAGIVGSGYNTPGDNASGRVLSGSVGTRTVEWATARGYPATSTSIYEDALEQAIAGSGYDSLSGNASDLNGRLLYPDGQPRVRMAACPGGTTYAYINRMPGLRPVRNVLEYFRNGGGWIGSCAGTDLMTKGFTINGNSFLSGGGRCEYQYAFDYAPFPVQYWSSSRGRGGVNFYLNDGTGSEQGPNKLSNSHFMMDVSQWDPTASTYLVNANGKYRDLLQFSQGSFIPKNLPGGQRADVEYLAYYDPSSTSNPAYYDTTAGAISLQNAWASFAYFDPNNPLSGRLAGTFPHPEINKDGLGIYQGWSNSTSGSPRLLKTGVGWWEYLFRELDYIDQRSQSLPLIPKAILQKATPVIMNGNSTMVGDKQYHYFVVQVPNGATNLSITLSGLTTNADLYIKKDGWPLVGSYDAKSTNSGTNNDQINISQPSAGTHLLTVYGNHSIANGAPYTVTADWDPAIPVTVTYETWKGTYFNAAELLNPLVSGASVDPEGDGLSNLLEYTLMKHPKQADSAGSIVCGTTNLSGQNYLTLTCIRRIDSGTTQILPQASSNLVDWDTQPTPLVLANTDHGDGSQTITYRDTVPMQGATTRFLRLKVILP